MRSVDLWDAAQAGPMLLPHLSINADLLAQPIVNIA